MLQKFKSLNTIPKIIVGIIAIALFPITLIVLSACFTVKNFKQKNIGKSIIGIILVLFFVPANVTYISGITDGFSSVTKESASNDTPKENSINVEKETSNDDTSTEVSNNQNNPSKSQLEMIQATTQIALEKNGFKNDTSHSLENWNINSMEYNDTIRWNSVTQSSNNGRIKAIFDWSGEDKDDLILKYLLVNGNEVVNDLKK